MSAASLLAINANGAGNATIYNSGLVKGFILLDADDTFINQKGGVFETKLTSYFSGGNDLFRNEQGGTVLAATIRASRRRAGSKGSSASRTRGLSRSKTVLWAMSSASRTPPAAPI